MPLTCMYELRCTLAGQSRPPYVRAPWGSGAKGRTDGTDDALGSGMPTVPLVFGPSDPSASGCQPRMWARHQGPTTKRKPGRLRAAALGRRPAGTGCPCLTSSSLTALPGTPRRPVARRPLCASTTAPTAAGPAKPRPRPEGRGAFINDVAWVPGTLLGLGGWPDPQQHRRSGHHLGARQLNRAPTQPTRHAQSSRSEPSSR